MTYYTNVLFSYQELLDKKFLQTDLGELYQAIPFDELAKHIPPTRGSISGLGCKAWFDVKGGIALQILKSYLQLSDAMLIQRINTDWSMQLFCGLSLKPTERILDEDLPSKWRMYIGKHLDIEKMQATYAHYWHPYIDQSGIGMQDATCYESRIAYPTDAKLLWKSCEQVYSILQETRKKQGLRKSRCQFEKHKAVFVSYQKLRKKSKRKEKAVRKKLLKLLVKLLTLLDKQKPQLSLRKIARLQTIVKVYEQQHQRAYGKADEGVKDRIVSLSKPYIRPIVRGKEVKPVEFGAKVNKLQVDGISFIEHLSFDAFNEGTHYENGIYLQRKLFGKCTHQSADAIYATNKNRTYSKQQGIYTNFAAKGREKQGEIEQNATLRKLLNKQRGIVLEGSFGNEKNHYHLQKINARTKPTEICWIFFGIMTANASIIASRMQEKNKQLARAA